MEKQVVDRLILENLIPTTSLESLAKGYVLNCRCEGKSPKTIEIYEVVLRNFAWYCRQNNFPQEVLKLSAIHIRHFLWYLSSETNRWGSNNPAARKPASQTTVNDYPDDPPVHTARHLPLSTSPLLNMYVVYPTLSESV